MSRLSVLRGLMIESVFINDTATSEIYSYCHALSLHDALPISTGRPKGVVLSNRNLAAVWRMSAAVPGFDYRADDVVMTVMPQFHVAGINTGLLALYHGAAMVIASDFAPAALLALIERHRRSEEHTSELQSLMRISYAVFCLKKKIQTHKT